MEPKLTSNRLTGLPMLLAVASLLGGCVGLAQTNNAIQFSYDTSMLNDIAKRGGTPLVVRGEPFPERAGEFAQRASEILTANHRGPAFPVFLDAQQGSAANPWRTVLIVNPTRGVSASNACTDGVSGSAAAEGRITTVAALCLGSRAKTIVRGRSSNARGPQSPAVRSLLVQTALALYPTRDDDKDLDSSGGDYGM